MGLLNSKLRITEVGPAHWCPGCQSMHIFYIDKPTKTGSQWSWNNDLANPTFNPSMRIYIPAIPKENIPEQTFCHYFLQQGKIKYLSDCQHALAGQEIDLPDLPASHNQD